jgi:hypothetical protein
VQEHFLTTLWLIKQQAKQLLTALCLDQASCKTTLIMFGIVPGVKSGTAADTVALPQCALRRLIMGASRSSSTQEIQGSSRY